MRLIDADALIDDAMDRYCKDCDKRKGIKNGKYRIIYEIGDVPCRACDVDDMVNDIESAPTVDPVKHGKWIKNDGRYGWHCSVCGEDDFYAFAWNSDKGENELQDHYCPNCGAEMKGEANDE